MYACRSRNTGFQNLNMQEGLVTFAADNAHTDGSKASAKANIQETETELMSKQQPEQSGDRQVSTLSSVNQHAVVQTVESKGESREQMNEGAQPESEVEISTDIDSDLQYKKDTSDLGTVSHLAEPHAVSVTKTVRLLPDESEVQQLHASGSENEIENVVQVSERAEIGSETEQYLGEILEYLDTQLHEDTSLNNMLTDNDAESVESDTKRSENHDSFGQSEAQQFTNSTTDVQGIQLRERNKASSEIEQPLGEAVQLREVASNKNLMDKEAVEQVESDMKVTEGQINSMRDVDVSEVQDRVELELRSGSTQVNGMDSFNTTMCSTPQVAQEISSTMEAGLKSTASKSSVYVNYEIPDFTSAHRAQDLSVVCKNHVYEVVSLFLPTEATKSATKFIPYKATLRRAIPRKIKPTQKKQKHKILTHTNSVGKFLSKEELRTRYKHRHPPLHPKDEDTHSDIPHKNPLEMGHSDCTDTYIHLYQPMIFSGETDSKLYTTLEVDSQSQQKKTKESAVCCSKLKTKEELCKMYRHRPPPPRLQDLYQPLIFPSCQPSSYEDYTSAVSYTHDHASQGTETLKESSSSLLDYSATDTLYQPLIFRSDDDTKIYTTLQNTWTRRDQEHASHSGCQETQTFSMAKELSSSLPDCSATDTHLYQPLILSSDADPRMYKTPQTRRGQEHASHIQETQTFNATKELSSSLPDCTATGTRLYQPLILSSDADPEMYKTPQTRRGQEHTSHIQETQTFSTTKELSSSLPDYSATGTHLYQPLILSSDADPKMYETLQNTWTRRDQEYASHSQESQTLSTTKELSSLPDHTATYDHMYQPLIITNSEADSKVYAILQNPLTRRDKEHEDQTNSGSMSTSDKSKMYSAFGEMESFSESTEADEDTPVRNKSNANSESDFNHMYQEGQSGQKAQDEEQIPLSLDEVESDVELCEHQESRLDHENQSEYHSAAQKRTTQYENVCLKEDRSYTLNTEPQEYNATQSADSVFNDFDQTHQAQFTSGDEHCPSEHGIGYLTGNSVFEQTHQESGLEHENQSEHHPAAQKCTTRYENVSLKEDRSSTLNMEPHEYNATQSADSLFYDLDQTNQAQITSGDEHCPSEHKIEYLTGNSVLEQTHQESRLDHENQSEHHPAAQICTTRYENVSLKEDRSSTLHTEPHEYNATQSADSLFYDFDQTHQAQFTSGNEHCPSEHEIGYLTERYPTLDQPTTVTGNFETLEGGTDYAPNIEYHLHTDQESQLPHGSCPES